MASLVPFYINEKYTQQPTVLQAKEELGRGRRSRGVSLNYAEGGDDGLADLLGDELSPGGERGSSAGCAATCGVAWAACSRSHSCS